MCRGTYSKHSHILGARRPFKKDNELFNYEIDSEAEWEEEDDVQEGACQMNSVFCV
jgi:chromatin assembly factor 1 subunit A